MRKPTMGMPPKKAAAATVPPGATDERKVHDFINKGGSPAVETTVPETDAPPTINPPAVKQINVKPLATEVESINGLRERRPRPRSGRKPGISLHDWIVEAVQEKIARESKKTGK